MTLKVFPKSDYVSYPQSWTDYFHNFFPTLYGKHWFVTTYVCLMLISPLLNHLLKTVPEKQLRLYIMGGLVLFTVFPIVGATANQLSNLGFFVLLYMIAGYIRLYYDISGKNNTAYRHLLLAVLLYVLVLCFYVYKQDYMQTNSILVIASGVEFLIWVVQSKPRHSAIVNAVAGTTFGIYLIHENTYILFRLWGEIFKNQAHYGTGHLIVHAFSSVAIVFAVCMLIDLLRKYTVEKIWARVIDGGLESLIAVIAKETADVFRTAIKFTVDLLNGSIRDEEYPRWKLVLGVSVGISLFMLVLGAYPSFLEVMRQGEDKTTILRTLIRYSAASALMYVILFVGVAYITSRICIYMRKNPSARECTVRIGLRLLGAAAACLIILKLFHVGYRELFIMFFINGYREFFVLCLAQIQSCLWFRKLS